MLNPLAVGKGLAARITAGMRLLEDQPEVLIVHLVPAEMQGR